MKSNSIKSLTMRPVLLLLLFVTGFAYADPIVPNPVTPFSVCDDNNDGFALFDLHTADAMIIMGQPNVVISYHETLTDAMIGAFGLGSPYINIAPYIQTLYVRATDTTDNTYAITTMDIRVLPTPLAYQVPNITQVDIPYDGFASFDITSNYNAITGGAPGIIVTYFETVMDAQTNSNAIAAPSAYINTANPQTIYARVENGATACYNITSFQLRVTNPDIVFIPDPNFKFELVYGNIATDADSNPVVLDVNSDGEIQVTEALLAYRLDPINIATTTFEGIKSFLNLQVFYTSPGVAINTLDVSGMQNLKDLRCPYNQIQTLNIANCPSLEVVFCNSNFLNTLDLTGKPNLKNVWCEQNSLTELDVTGAPLLQYLSCRNNFLDELDLTHNTALTDLNVGVNNLTSLDLSHCVNLVNFHCASAPIESLDFTGLNNIENLNVRYTEIISLDVSNLVNLTTFDCDGLNIDELDLSHNPVLCSVQCNNTELTYLNIKNGGTCNSVYMITGNANLAFVCADDDEASYYQNSFIGQGFSTVVNSYCTFVPGGNYNTITGQITFDSNNNGCDPSDATFPHVKVKIVSSTDEGSTFTTTNGNYNFYVGSDTYNVTPEIENPSWFNITPASTSVVFNDNNNNVSTNNFCISANGAHPDLEIVVSPLNAARPGFDAMYKIAFKNKGNQTMSQQYGISFSFNANQMSFVSATTSPSNMGIGTINWDYANLMPFESRSITVTCHVNSPVDANPVNINDILTLTAIISPQNNDENVSDNTFIHNQTVVGSYDPNEITCLEGNSEPVTEIGKYLHYAVNFENTGNYYAENVVVKDIIDENMYDISSLQLLSTSHPAYVKVTGNVVEFIFKNINLAAVAGNPPVGGHGDVLFKIKSKNTLAEGDSVNKLAKIYFDYNAPITTNEAETTFVNLNTDIHEFDNSVTIYPNPTHSIINISGQFTIKSVQLYDVQGRLLETDLVNGNDTVFDISGKQSGVYFVKITSEKGSKIEKVVKK